jgi:glutathione synthase/RimK-type ligase-like ATP-grasp enzyme
MRLLVTNAHTPQAYAVVRALRPHAERVVATYEGDGWLAGLAHASWSRHVDARYRVPSVVADWTSGRFLGEPTAAELAWVEAMARVCERERIDVIFPSWDPYVFALSKHRERFLRLGVRVPVPPFDVAATALDKYLTVRAGEAVGFPCPRTYLYESPAQLAEIAARETFPLILKPRFTSGGHGMAIVRTVAELLEAAPRIAAAYGPPLVQEYIPGGQRDSVQFVLGKDGTLLFAFHKRRLRTFRRTARFGTVSESASPDERLLKTAALVRKSGWWGAMGIETIRDPRDGQDKLMEINPRFPRQVWNRVELGINEPLMCVRLARDEHVEPVPQCEPGILFVNPVEDVGLFLLQILDLAVYRWRTGVGGEPLLDPECTPLSLRDQWRSYRATYRSTQRKVLDPYTANAWRDPLPSLLWWMQFATWLVGSRTHLGR